MSSDDSGARPRSWALSSRRSTSASRSEYVAVTCSSPVRPVTRQLIRRSRSPGWNGRTPASRRPHPAGGTRCPPTRPSARGTVSAASNPSRSGQVVTVAGLGPQRRPAEHPEAGGRPDDGRTDLTPPPADGPDRELDRRPLLDHDRGRPGSAAPARRQCHATAATSIPSGASTARGHRGPPALQQRVGGHGNRTAGPARGRAASPSPAPSSSGAASTTRSARRSTTASSSSPAPSTPPGPAPRSVARPAGPGAGGLPRRRGGHQRAGTGGTARASAGRAPRQHLPDHVLAARPGAATSPASASSGARDGQRDRLHVLGSHVVPAGAAPPAPGRRAAAPAHRAVTRRPAPAAAPGSPRPGRRSSRRPCPRPHLLDRPLRPQQPVASSTGSSTVASRCRAIRRRSTSSSSSRSG